ncbi:MAG: NADH-quinone oxidoreductase subunit NuoN [Candidatus Mycalebacterium zealandia]|nr:MAG: NADH-quinone oxidoreductase subunit NuoN [Candidatus Mycalebacterium zealandia]
MTFNQLLQSASLTIPELILCSVGLVLIVLGPALKKTAEKHLYSIPVNLVRFACVAAFYFNLERFDFTASAFSGSLTLDTFAGYFNGVLLLNAMAATFFAKPYIRDHEKLREFLALAVFCTAGMMFMVESVEFVAFFVAFETMSICVYALSGFSRNIFSSAEAGLKYLITGGFASAVMLLGIALLYGAAGTLSFAEIGAAFSDAPSNPMLITGTVLVLAGFIFKIGAAPLHQWIPDVYQGAPMPATTFMSVGVKVAAFAVFSRFAVEIGSSGQWGFEEIIIVVAVITMVAGNVSAIAQKNIKRMLAYSSVAHAGYALVGIATWLSGENADGLSGIFYYMYAYTIMTLGAFGVISLLGRDGDERQTFSDISGLWKTNPMLAVALAVFMFSLAGIPPTIGFFAKYKVFAAAAYEGLHWLVIIALVNSVVSAYYYLKVLAFAFMRPISKQQTGEWKLEPESVFAIAFLCAAVLLMGIFPLYPTAGFIDAATQALVGK